MLILPSYSLDETQENSLKSFLLQEEWKSVYISSYLFNNGTYIGAKDNNRLWVLIEDTDRVVGAIYLTASGAVFPRFSDRYRPEKETDRILAKQIKGIMPYMVLGDKKSCKIILNLLDKDISSSKSHALMIKNPKDDINRINNKADNVIIRYAEPKDMEELYQLQEDYEKEEVLPSPSMFSPASCIHKINSRISSRTLLVAEVEGKIASKAEISAIGVNTEQIGGVYTSPQYRGQGLASSLVKELIGIIEKRSKIPCLFVRKGNKPAYHIYKKLGFITVSDFFIAYLNKGF